MAISMTVSQGSNSRSVGQSVHLIVGEREDDSEPRTTLVGRILITATILWPMAAIAHGQLAAPTSYESARRKIDQTFNSELNKLAEEYGDCAEPLLRLLRNLRMQHDSSREYLVVAPIETPTAQTGRDRECLGALAKLRKQYAQRLFQLAKSLARENASNLAYRILHEVSFHDPEHRTANVVTKNTIHARAKIAPARGRSVQPKYRWPAGSYYIVKSPNYFVVSNATEQESTRLAEQLELLNSAWRQVFFEYWSSSHELARSIERDVPLRIPKRKHRIVLFANQQEYIAAIERIEPRARMTLGYYDAERETAYFYVKPSGESNATWKHEATHQLFSELRRVRPDLGQDANFWIVEGLALYMESLQLRQGYSFVGGLEADRLQFARYRRLCENFYVPLDQLAAVGKLALQNDKDIRRIYSQSAGLTHFLMRTRRDALMRFIQQVYSGRDSVETLALECNESFEQLDAAYRDFLTVDDAQLNAIDSRATIANLSLGCCPITDEGFANLDLSHVNWLDLTATRINDAGTVPLVKAAQLRQLSLYATAISDETIKRLANAHQLEELNLTKTQVTDASVPTLLQLPKLTTLEVDDTRISPQQIHRLKQAFPQDN